MENYYYIDTVGERQGPLSMEKLLAQGITAQTFVWREGMNDWKAAASLPELSAHFGAVPPPTPQELAATQKIAPARPDDYLVWAILSTLFCCLPLGIVSIIYATRVSSYYIAGDYEAAYEASQKAKNWAIWGFATAGIAILLYIFIIMVGIAANII